MSLSLSPARALSPALSLSLSLGALSCSLVSVCRPQILRRASKELPAFLKELRTTPRLPNLLNYYSRSKRYLSTPTTLFVPAFFLLAPNFANMGKKFEAATHSMAFFLLKFFFLKKNRQKSKGFGLGSPDLEGLKSLMCPPILCRHLSLLPGFFLI